MKNQKGFSLIELLVVIAILGVLAAIIIQNVDKFIDSDKIEVIGNSTSNILTFEDRIANIIQHSLNNTDYECTVEVDYRLCDTTDPQCVDIKLTYKNK